RKQDLVFDVGANVGEYAEIFSGLADAVVAFEPNPACLESLLRVAKRRGNILIDLSAVGDKTGTAQMNVCQFSHFGTLNDQFIAESVGSEDYKDVHWSGKIPVPVVTLNQMAAHYGTPSFIKIDVEGFEDKVIRGMSFRP